ncbi:MFS transporter [Shewanella psychrotolerans]|uniref:MFS transporter n=1 Tax=Shewanella psychrotolerans TaxID=2864206 RepID=UPI001C656F43|nr:MFS transporter [Shewanella psychrotolerans]QYK02212.1 MFS transporter [Shewanella psychrotolerans]
MPRNVWVLTLAQAFAMSATPMMMLLGGLIGVELAPTPSLATLPIGMMVIGVAVSIIPVSRLMRRFGRKRVFIFGACYGALAGVVAAIATQTHGFSLFCFSGLMLGTSGAIVQQYRFAAMESVEAIDGAKAASRVLVGGLIAAVVGPELAVLGSHLIRESYVGAFLFLTLVCLIAAMVLTFYQEPLTTASNVNESVKDGRPLAKILLQPQIWTAIGAATIGYGMMSFVMTATPLHMHHMEHHSLADTKWVIQSHIIAMYFPSLFSGYLMAKFGTQKMMLAGLFAYGLTITIALMGHELLNYWVALVLLGIGWNFLFVVGTVLLSSYYQREERFKVQSFNDAFVFSSQAIASLSAGLVLYHLGWKVMLVSCIPLIAIHLCLMAWGSVAQLKHSKLGS